jgi:hypothetical protein
LCYRRLMEARAPSSNITRHIFPTPPPLFSRPDTATNCGAPRFESLHFINGLILGTARQACGSVRRNRKAGMLTDKRPIDLAAVLGSPYRATLGGGKSWNGSPGQHQSVVFKFTIGYSF